MDVKLPCVSSDNESTGSSESNYVANVTAPPPPPPPITRFRCSHCSKTFSSERQLLNHENKASSQTATRAEIFQNFAAENPQFLSSSLTPLPAAVPATSNNTTRFTANTTNHVIPMEECVGNNHQRYHPYMRPRERQIFPTFPVVDGSLERTMDLLSLMDQPESLVSNQEIPKIRENDVNQAVSGQGASTRLDVEDMDLDLKL